MSTPATQTQSHWYVVHVFRVRQNKLVDLGRDVLNAMWKCYFLSERKTQRCLLQDTSMLAHGLHAKLTVLKSYQVFYPCLGKSYHTADKIFIFIGSGMVRT